MVTWWLSAVSRDGASVWTFEQTLAPGSEDRSGLLSPGFDEEKVSKWQIRVVGAAYEVSDDTPELLSR